MTSLPQLCDRYVEVEDDPWAGTSCKLPAGHEDECSPHYITLKDIDYRGGGLMSRRTAPTTGPQERHDA